MNEREHPYVRAMRAERERYDRWYEDETRRLDLDDVGEYNGFSPEMIERLSKYRYDIRTGRAVLRTPEPRNAEILDRWRKDDA